MSPARCYLAGPMSGLPDLNFPAFHRTAKWLREQGLKIENPAENTPPEDPEWIDWMRMAVAQLVKCDAVIMLNGWQKSRGATVEYELAQGLGLWVYSLVEPEDRDPFLVVLWAGDNARKGRLG